MKLAIAQPTAPVVRLDVLQPSTVRSPLDRFRCEPYNATLTARSCVDRQAAAAVQSRDGRSLRPQAKLGDYVLCRECSIGAAVRKAVAS